MARLAFFKWDTNILAPRDSQKSGFIFVGLTHEHSIGTSDERDENIFELFMKYTDSQRRESGDDPDNGPRWKYCGRYMFGKTKEVPVSVWRTFDTAVSMLPCLISVYRNDSQLLTSFSSRSGTHRCTQVEARRKSLTRKHCLLNTTVEICWSRRCQPPTWDGHPACRRQYWMPVIKKCTGGICDFLTS